MNLKAIYNWSISENNNRNRNDCSIHLSARYEDYLYAMHNGRVVAEGKPSDIITGTLVKDIFALHCTVIQDPVSGSPFVVPKGRHHRR